MSNEELNKLRFENDKTICRFLDLDDRKISVQGRQDEK
jgi:hypothetical protein